MASTSLMELQKLANLQSGRVRDFQAAIQEVLDGLSTTYSQQLASLMTLNFQQFDDVSLMAA